MNEMLGAITSSIEVIGNSVSITELNGAYERIMRGDIPLSNEILHMLNHITNYNLVRLANDAYESPISRSEKLTAIRKCLESMKGEGQAKEETALLEDLYTSVANLS